MGFGRQWLALGMQDAFGNINADRQAKFKKIMDDVYALGDKFRLENCFETLSLLMNDQVDYQGKCLVDHIEVKKLLFYPFLRKSPAIEIFAELASIILRPENSSPLAKTIAREEYQRLEMFCEVIDPKHSFKRDIFWVIQLCAYAEGLGMATVDREEWKYLALHFHKPGRKSRKFLELRQKYQSIGQNILLLQDSDHIDPVCKKYAACWQEAHEFIFRYGISYDGSRDSEELNKVESLSSELEAFLEALYRKRNSFGLSRSASLVIYLHWLVAWLYFAKSQCLNHNPDHDRAVQNQTILALEKCRLHLMQAYTQEASFSQLHTYKSRKNQACVYLQLMLADINRSLASFATETRFPIDHLVQSDPYGQYVQFSREVLKYAKKYTTSQDELWIQQAVFELTTNTSLCFPDEDEVKQTMKAFFELNRGKSIDRNRLSVRKTSNRFIYSLSAARQFFLETQKTDKKYQNQNAIGNFFIMPEPYFDEEAFFKETVSRFYEPKSDNRYLSFMYISDELFIRSYLLKSDWLELGGYVLRALYHMSAAHKEVKQAWLAEQNLEAAVRHLEVGSFKNLSKSELAYTCHKLVGLQAKAALFVARQAQSLYIGFEDRKILSEEEKMAISEAWMEKSLSLRGSPEKPTDDIPRSKNNFQLFSILDEFIEYHASCE